MTPWTVRVFLVFVRPILRIWFGLNGLRRENHPERVPRSGGLLILANHQSYMDPPVVQICCRRRVWFMAKQELFEMPRIGRFMSWYGAFPVKQNAPDRSALNRAIELLKAGETVCIFPEGGVAPEGELKELQGGAALIVRKAECAVICCGIENTREMMPADSTKLRKSEKPVTVRWGEPRSFNKKSPAEEILAWASEELRSLIS